MRRHGGQPRGGEDHIVVGFGCERVPAAGEVDPGRNAHQGVGDPTSFVGSWEELTEGPASDAPAESPATAGVAPSPWCATSHFQAEMASLDRSRKAVLGSAKR